MLRQGDVLLVPVNSDEVKLDGYEKKEKKHRHTAGLVLAEGEATGHHHRVVQRGRRTTARIRTGTVSSTNQKARILTVPKGGAELVHEEHATIKLPAGKFLVQGQREFVAPAPTERKRTEAQTTRRVFD